MLYLCSCIVLQGLKLKVGVVVEDVLGVEVVVIATDAHQEAPAAVDTEEEDMEEGEYHG